MPWTASISIDRQQHNKTRELNLKKIKSHLSLYSVVNLFLWTFYNKIKKQKKIIDTQRKDQLVAVSCWLITLQWSQRYFFIWSVSQCNNCNMGLKLKCLLVRRTLLLPLALLIVFHIVSSSSQQNPTSAHGKWLNWHIRCHLDEENLLHLMFDAVNFAMITLISFFHQTHARTVNISRFYTWGYFCCRCYYYYDNFNFLLQQ